MAGVNIGKVKDKSSTRAAPGRSSSSSSSRSTRRSPRTSDPAPEDAPGRDLRALSQGHKDAGFVEDGGRLENQQVESTVELDEIFSSFDELDEEGVPGVGVGATVEDAPLARSG